MFSEIKLNILPIVIHLRKLRKFGYLNIRRELVIECEIGPELYSIIQDLRVFQKLVVDGHVGSDYRDWLLPRNPPSCIVDDLLNGFLEGFF